MNKVITFDKSGKEEILTLYNKTVNSDGYIVEKDNPEQIVLSPDGNPLEYRQFAGIKKGSLIFIKSDINSLIELYNILK